MTTMMSETRQPRPDPLVVENAELRVRIAALEALLRREVIARELAQESAARAWALGCWPRPRLDNRPNQDGG
jgi:hypothetical protein